VVDIAELALLQVALGDGWLYSFGRDATTGTVRALADPSDGEAVDRLLTAAAAELGGENGPVTLEAVRPPADEGWV
jgi:predicted transcriptional regulator